MQHEIDDDKDDAMLDEPASVRRVAVSQPAKWVYYGDQDEMKTSLSVERLLEKFKRNRVVIFLLSEPFPHEIHAKLVWESERNSRENSFPKSLQLFSPINVDEPANCKAENEVSDVFQHILFNVYYWRKIRTKHLYIYERERIQAQSENRVNRQFCVKVSDPNEGTHLLLSLNSLIVTFIAHNEWKTSV